MFVPTACYDKRSCHPIQAVPGLIAAIRRTIETWTVAPQKLENTARRPMPNLSRTIHHASCVSPTGPWSRCNIFLSLSCLGAPSFLAYRVFLQSGSDALAILA
jgi:hypothetical protein